MNFQQAIEHLTSGDAEHKEDAIQAIYDAVEPLCETDTSGDMGYTTTLYEWLLEGNYHESDTPESIAEEWDELSQD